MSAKLSRREWMSRWLPTSQGKNQTAEATTQSDVPMVAIIQGRFCLAHRNTFCSICYERCPEPEAMQVDHGIPMVNPDKCTGCGICHDVCPAPRNAVLMHPAKKD
jgi:Pyruvate/2-oxoacid:ferredoxin oxidoreductase delta subunit